MAQPPDYGIIYNWDGVPHALSEVPQSMEAFLGKVFAPVTDTQVGALFWCVVDHSLRWHPKEGRDRGDETLEVVGDVHGRTYGSAGAYLVVENIRQMLDRGEDPQQAIVDRARQLGLQVYASVRMNDNHFDGAQPGAFGTGNDSEMTRLRLEHPEWLLGDRTVPWFAGSWNFEHPELRRHKLALLEETCRAYDWDGLEMDWQRHPFHLPQDCAYRMRYVLTDLQRSARRMTERVAAERGRPLYLAARVAPTLEASYDIGYDVPTWIEEGLVDVLIPAGGYGTDPSIDVAGYVQLCAGTEVAVYPGLDVWLSSITGGEHSGHIVPVGPEDAFEKEQMLNRAVAGRFYEEGARGIYIFNWYADTENRRELLNQLGSTNTLAATDKVFAATHRAVIADRPWAGGTMHDRVRGDVPVRLKPTLTGEGPKISLHLTDDVLASPPRQLELRVRLEEWVKGDEVQLAWDGVAREGVGVRYDIHENDAANPFDVPISDVSTSVWLISKLTPEEAMPGLHRIGVAMNKRNPNVLSDPVLTDAEVLVRY